MKIKKYYCSDCKIHFIYLSCFKKHIESKSHVNKSNIKINKIKNFDLFKKDIFICDICDKTYLSNRSLQNHTQMCANNKTKNEANNKTNETTEKLKNEITNETNNGINNDIIEKLKNDLLNKDEQLKMQNEQIKMQAEQLKIKDNQLYEKDNQLYEKDNQLYKKDDIVHDALNIAKINSKTTHTSVNILKYANMYLNDAEPLNEIRGNDIYQAIKYCNPKKKEDTNEEYVKTVIHKFRHGIFANFIGDMIIEYYKPKIISDINLIASDTSRLCFIIMQKVKDKNKTEKKEWINDKSGKKFTELVLRPLTGGIVEIISEFIVFKNKKNLGEIVLELLTDCITLRRDINTDKFIKPILRHVAPNFHFDNLKLLDDDLNINDDLINNDSSDSDVDEKPKKIKIKKKHN